jgi:ketosteroid isomerase-like protein
MSEENVEMVRFPVGVRPTSRRHIAERLALRFPGAFAFATRLILRLPPRSRLRQLILRRAVQLAFEATNRGDFEAAFGLWDNDAETTYARQIASLGAFPRKTSGREERVRYQRRWHAEWDGLRFEPVECIDLGNRLLVLAHAKARGLGSGVAIDQGGAFLLTLSAGRVVREQAFLDRDEALEAAGLSE